MPTRTAWKESWKKEPDQESTAKQHATSVTQFRGNILDEVMQKWYCGILYNTSETLPRKKKRDLWQYARQGAQAVDVNATIRVTIEKATECSHHVWETSDSVLEKVIRKSLVAGHIPGLLIHAIGKNVCSKPNKTCNL